MASLKQYFTQTQALMRKTFIIVGVRHFWFTFFRAFLLPVAFMIFIAYAKNLFIPPSRYGIGDPFTIPSLVDTVGNRKLVFINNELGPAVDAVIEKVATPVRKAGKQVLVLNNTDDLLVPCKQNLLGDSKCYAAVQFNSIPDSSDNGSMWNYTLRGNIATSSALTVKVHSQKNKQGSFLPLQLAVDNAILGSDMAPQESVYTSLSERQRNDRIRVRYNGAIIKVLGVAFFIGMVPVTYHIVGLLSVEREAGLSQLLTVMGASQAARLSSLHYTFTLLYLPGWIIMALVLAFAVFAKSNLAIILLLHIIGGVALTSASVFVACFFKKAQLSGIIATLLALLLGILAQVSSKASTGTVAILGLLFPPMTYVYSLIALAHFEQDDYGLSLIKAPPGNNSTLPAIAFFAFFIIQAVLYPILASHLENYLYGTASSGLTFGTVSKEGLAVEITGLTKRFVPNWFQRKFSKKETIVAVNSLDLGFRQGEVSVLLGANGSGKTTTLEMIAGLSKISSGTVKLRTDRNMLSICPQKNVLWDDLTVEEAVQIWSRLKCSNDSKAACEQLIKDCDLFVKRKALCKTLSGGQKRKLQLAVCFSGADSGTICLIDEITSGLDPVSRRKIHEIIEKQRGRKTLVITSHYLSEAESIADHIVILSKGVLKCEGSTAELKTKLGGGYRVCCKDGNAPYVEGYKAEKQPDQTVYLAEDAASAGNLIRELSSSGFAYTVDGPSIESVFMRVSDEATTVSSILERKDRPLQLYKGKRVGILRQIWVMFQKRWLIFRRNPLPTSAALTIPIIAAALTMHFVSDFSPAGCSIRSGIEASDLESFSLKDLDLNLIVGPPSSFSLSQIGKFESLLGSAIGDPSNSQNQINSSYLADSIHIVDKISDFKNTIVEKYQNITPGGVWYTGKKSDTPLISFKANGGLGLFNSVFLLNILTNLRIGGSSSNNGSSLIITGYKDFDYTWPSGTGDSLLFITYFGLAMAVFPSFFVLYPTAERLKYVRNMQYSNGVRPAALWTAYTAFDFIIVLAISVIVTGIFAGSVSAWFELGHLWLVFVLYGLAMTLGTYLVSLVCKSQLSAFAISAGTSCVAFLLYMIAYMSILTYAPLEDQQNDILIAHYVFSIFFPISSLLRSLFAALNLFQILCKHEQFMNGNALEAYGGPILFLIIQILFCGLVLFSWESGFFSAFRPFGKLQRSQVKDSDEENKQSGVDEKEVGEEIRRVDSLKEGLRVIDVTKAFGKNIAVKDATFGVNKGQVLGLLGPNGAGKSTTISMIRSDILPTRGEILIGDISVRRHRFRSREMIGVCPQFDFVDSMTVLEILRFYAKIRGIKDVNHNVNVILDSVNLREFSNRMASKLSGGNKRKLSLGIALMGNPLVLLLDEPSSALDAAAKRVIWATINSIAPGRSIILTSHDMEESAYLCSKVLILNKQILTIGTTDFLREKHGAFYHVQLVFKSAPNTTEEEILRATTWVQNNFPQAIVEERTFHSGQLKFKVPLSWRGGAADQSTDEQNEAISEVPSATDESADVVHRLFASLEQQREELGIAYYSLSQTSLEDVFLRICGDEVVEEGYDDHGHSNGEEKFSTWRRFIPFKKSTRKRS